MKFVLLVRYKNRLAFLASPAVCLHVWWAWKFGYYDAYMTVPQMIYWMLQQNKEAVTAQSDSVLNHTHPKNQGGYFLPRFLSVCFRSFYWECFNIKRFFLEYWSSGMSESLAHSILFQSKYNGQSVKENSYRQILSKPNRLQFWLIFMCVGSTPMRKPK